MRILFRLLAAFLASFLLLIPAARCFAQNVPQTGSPAGAQTSAPASAPEADTDSADIPPFARDRISEAEYFALRDQENRTRRGLDDLLRNPQARSQAILRLEFQEQLGRRVMQGLTPLSGLLAAPVTPAWTPLGPDPIPNGQTSPTEVAVSGRVTAIAVDPTSDLIVYVGTAQGGLYRSLDGGASWTALMDSAQSLAIGAITIDPLNHDTVFVGTGEGNLSGDSFFGVGLYIIRNASTVSPALSGPFNSNGITDVFTGRAITRILVNPADDNKVLISTASGVSGLSSESFNVLPARGVYLSTNALSTTVTPTFAKQTIQTAVADRTVTDMVMDPNNVNKVLVYVFGAAAAGDGGLWMSTAGDPWTLGAATWTQNPAFIRSGFGKFAVNSVGAPAVTTFMLAQDQTVACGGTLTSAGSVNTSPDGVTWTAVPAANGFCGGQCFYDMVPAFHPDNASTIYLGGSADGSTGTCSSNVLTRSINGGASFSRNDALLHADSHALTFAPSNHNVVYFGNDGGVFKSTDAGVTWSSINTSGFNATQFEGLSLHPTDPNFAIGGTQDNGTEFMKPDGTWTRADFGDGGYSAIDQSSTDTTNVTMYHTYFNQTNGLIAFARVTNVAGATEGSWSVFGCPAQPGLTLNGITCTDAVLFYAPLALGPGNPNTLYFGTDHLYRSTDRGATMAVVSQANFGCCDAQGRNFRVSSIGISPQDDNIRIVGLTNGKAFATTTGANPLVDVTGGWTARFIARAEIDPNNSNTAYVTLDGYGTLSHVWKTTNLAGGGGTFAAASTGLPDAPVNAFAVDPLNSNYLYAGTDIGVFNSIDGGATWNAYGTGLPRVAVFDLNVHKVSHKVRIGTHGRGAWEIAATSFANVTSLTANFATPAIGQNVIFTANVNKGTGIRAPTGTVTFLDGVTSLGTGAVDGAGNATFQTTALTAGGHNVTAVYGGDSLYLSSTSAVFVVDVTTPGTTPTTTSLVTSTNSSAFGSAVTFTATVAHSTGVPAPTGNVTFDDGVTLIGSAAVDAQGHATLQTSSLTFGPHTITATYGGDATYAGSTSSAVAVSVLAATTLALSASPLNPVQGNNVTFTATLTINGTLTVPAGQTATFRDGANTIGTSPFLDSVVTTFQTSTLAVGPHTITAQFNGDAVFAGSTSPAVIVTVSTAPPDYSVNIPNASATIAAGQPASYTISVTPQNGFTATISFGCAGLPAASSCAFNPTTLTPNGSAASTTLTLSTTARSVASARPLSGTTLAALVSFGFLGIVFLGSASRRKRSSRTACMLLVLAVAVLAIASCGGGGPKPPPVVTGTPAGTYSVTVSATSGTTTHNSTITLVVQ